MIDGYAWRGSREAMLRFGDPGLPALLILQPLFDEANRTRRFLVQTMRELAERGIGSVLPDLPGTGDSPVATEEARWPDWADAIATVAATLPRPLLTVAVRGSALLDGYAGADARWRLAPENGARLLRDMLRASSVASGRKPAEIEADARIVTTRLAGNPVDPAMFRAIEAATVEAGDDVRTVCLSGDAIASGSTITGSPLWRRVEPGDDDAMRHALVDDLCRWIETCAAH